MSALDSLIAQDAGAGNAQPSLDALIAQDAGGASPALTTSPAAPAPQASPWNAPGGFVMGMGDALRGGAQGIAHGLSWAADKIAPDSQLAKDARAALPQMQQTIDAQNQQYAQQRAASGGSGIDLARLAGNAVGTAPTLALGPEYAALSLPGKIGLGALQGAAGAGMMPTADPSNGQSFAAQKATQMGLGAALGGAAPAAVGGATAIGRGIWNVAQPVVQPGRFVGNGLAGAMSPQDAAAVAQSIRGAQQFVPGSLPTTAQAGASPMLVQTEKALANDSPDFRTALLNRTIGNNDARWNALMGVAQTPEALQAAQAARGGAAAPLYTAAHSATVPVDSTFTVLQSRPSVQAAMSKANTLAAEEGVALQWPSAKNPQISGQALDYLGRGLNDQISEAQRLGSDQQVRALTKTADAIDQWGQQNIPAIAQARAAYAAGSVPVNTMEVGQQIANGLGTRAMNAGGAPEIQMMPFRSALTSAMASGNAAKYGIDADALNSLQGIGQDLQRATISNSVRTPGSDTAYNLAANGWLARNLYGPNFQGATGLGKAVAAGGALLAGHPLAAGGALAASNKLGQSVGARLQGNLGSYLLDPNALLPFLDSRAAASSGQALPGPAVRGLLNYGRPAVVNGLLGGILQPANQ
ncbi:hypothetical protein PQR01_00455 [Paraburkholderia rhynchosiae]|uniref:Uncharacterized protein n=1 Tax=Paraburkholderia rhynchosiae TaxID=487049 RepID=A0ACC7N2Z6_9BURK